MSLADAQRRVDAWIAQFEEGYFDPLTNMARLSEEVGELAREVNHRFGRKTKKKGEADGDLGMEMADILFVVICMANREGIDLQAAFDRMMAKVETRDAERWTKKQGTTPTPSAPPPAPPAAPDSSPTGPRRSPLPPPRR
jgi:NTP pyrophosphatase (non-canonical NTP hydrolase)